MLGINANKGHRGWTGVWALNVIMILAGSEAVFDEVSFEKLAELLLADQTASRHLEPYFNGMPVLGICHEVICAYVLHRFRQGAIADLINGELLTLKRMFEKAIATVPPIVAHAPRIPVPAEVEAMLRTWLESANNEGGW